jgi:putative cell wall-binding protein
VAALAVLALVLVPGTVANASPGTATFRGSLHRQERPGHPISGYGVALWADGGDRPVALGESDANGRFDLGTVPPGSYHFQIGAPADSWHEYPTIEAGDVIDLDIVLPYPAQSMYSATERLSGGDRYETAVAVSRYSFNAAVPGTPGAPVVYVASGEDFPDALSAAPAAATQGGPLLLTPGGALPAAVAAEISRLAPARIVVVGGRSVVGDAVFAALQSLAPTVDRIAGVDRYDTSRRVARYAFSRGWIAFLATGVSYPDALVAGGVAGSSGTPIILVDGRASAVDGPTLDLIRDMGFSDARIAGGVNAVSSGIEESLRAHLTFVARFAGADRYETSRLINQWAYIPPRHVFFASGENFPDALSAAAEAGGLHLPVYLVPPTCVPAAITAIMEKPDLVTLVGGRQALSYQLGYLQPC